MYVHANANVIVEKYPCNYYGFYPECLSTIKEIHSISGYTHIILMGMCESSKIH